MKASSQSPSENKLSYRISIDQILTQISSKRKIELEKRSVKIEEKMVLSKVCISQSISVSHILFLPQPPAPATLPLRREALADAVGLGRRGCSQKTQKSAMSDNRTNRRQSSMWIIPNDRGEDHSRRRNQNTKIILMRQTRALESHGRA